MKSQGSLEICNLLFTCHDCQAKLENLYHKLLLEILPPDLLLLEKWLEIYNYQPFKRYLLNVHITDFMTCVPDFFFYVATKGCNFQVVSLCNIITTVHVPIFTNLFLPSMSTLSDRRAERPEISSIWLS